MYLAAAHRLLRCIMYVKHMRYKNSAEITSAYILKHTTITQNKSWTQTQNISQQSNKKCMLCLVLKS